MLALAAMRTTAAFSAKVRLHGRIEQSRFSELCLAGCRGRQTYLRGAAPAAASRSGSTRASCAAATPGTSGFASRSATAPCSFRSFRLNTASRHEGYFRLEWDLADQRTHKIARNRPFIIPVCLDATPAAGADVPESFQRVQWTHLPGGETPAAFVERVSQLLSPGRTVTRCEGYAERLRCRRAARCRPMSRRPKSVALLIALLLLLGGGLCRAGQIVPFEARRTARDADCTGENCRTEPAPRSPSRYCPSWT